MRTSDGVAIAYTLWRRPSREILVLAPGFWRVRRAKENLYLATHFVRRGYDVAAIDFRGHGESGGAYTFGPYETQDFLAVVEDLVGEGKPYSRFAVLGLSLGGSIAAEAVARHPHPPCRALALISSPAHVSALRPRPWKPGAARQVRLRHVLRMPRIAGRRLLAPKPRIARALAQLTIPKLIVTAEGDWLLMDGPWLRPRRRRWITCTWTCRAHSTPMLSSGTFRCLSCACSTDGLAGTRRHRRRGFTFQVSGFRRTGGRIFPKLEP